MPSIGTAFEQEARRHQVAALLEDGSRTQIEIAEQLGVSHSTVKRVAQALRQGGTAALATRERGGSEPRMTKPQKKELIKLLQRGAIAAGYDSDWWTLKRINNLIAKTFQIEYHWGYIGRLLKQLGWSRQLPKVHSPKRDEAAIEQWRERDWPRIKKKRNVASN